MGKAPFTLKRSTLLSTQIWVNRRVIAPHPLNPNYLINLVLPPMAVIMSCAQLMRGMMLFNLFAFLHDFFDGSLVDNHETPLGIVVVHDGIDGSIDNAVSFASVVPTGFVRVPSF